MSKNLDNIKTHTMNNQGTDANGLNRCIKSHLLPDKKMREIGFTDRDKNWWYYSRQVQFPKSKQYRHIDITFNVLIPKHKGRLKIDVLDEDFLQPYDYQYILYKSPTSEVALMVKEFVEKQMEYLQSQGVLSGHSYGDYI